MEEIGMMTLRVLASGLGVLAALALAGGCGDGGKTPPTGGPTGGKAPPKAAKADHPAHGAGPHGGTVADWGGGKYHVEFNVDHKKQEARVYILGSDEKTPAPVKAKELL